MNEEHENMYIRECPACGYEGKLITFNNPLDRRHYGYVKCINCDHQSHAMWIDNIRTFIEDVIDGWNKDIEVSFTSTTETGTSEDRVKELEERCLKLEDKLESVTSKLNEVIRHCNRVTEKIQNSKHRKFYFIHTILEDDNYGNDD